MSTDFGIDFAMVWTDGRPELDLSFVEVSGVEVVRDAVARRFVIPRGRLPWAPDVGLDLRSMLSDGFTDTELRALEARIRNQCEDDERVESADVTCTLTGGGTLTASISCVTSLGPFSLILRATEDLVQLLET